MKLDEFVTKLRDKQLSDKNKQDDVKKKYKDLDKKKDKLTQKEINDLVIKIAEMLNLLEGDS